MRQWVSNALAIAGVLVMCVRPVPARAQGNRGRLSVTVTDATGAVLPTATVTVTGLEASTRAATLAPVTASDVGVATFTNLAPGRYSIEATFPSFDKTILKDVRIRAGENRQTIVLRLSTMSDEITVGRDREEAASDRSSTFGTALTRDQIDQLSDDPDELQRQLQDIAGPGATIMVDSFEGAQLPPKSQIRSIRIARDQFAAENHYAGLSRIEIVTQPGIGPIQGGVGTGFSTSALDGSNPFVSQKPASQNNSYNTYISGGLVPNKMSFSLSLNGQGAYTTPLQYAVTPDGQIVKNSSLRTPNDYRSVYGQLDYAVTRDQTLRFYVNHFGYSSRNLGIGSYDLLERAYDSSNSNNSFYVQHTGPIGRRLISNTRLSLSWSDNDSHSAIDLPTIVVTDAFTSGGAQRTGGTHSRDVTVGSDIDYVRGINTIRFGLLADVYLYRSDSNSNYLGTYTFENLDAFEAGLPRSYTRRIGDPNIRYSNIQGGLYVQDDIKIHKNLTLSPGLRYETQTHVPGRWNLAPRMGATWAPFKNGRTTLRASVGVFYDWLSTNTYQQTLQVDGFRQQEVNILDPSYPDPGPITGVSPTNRYLLGDDIVLPRTTRVSLGVSQVFNQRFNAGVVYAYTRANGQLVGDNLNVPVDGVRPDPQFANVIEAVSDGRSRQQTINANFTITLSPIGLLPSQAKWVDWRRGLRVNANYTAGWYENNTDGPFSPPATDLASEWGPAPGDVRNRVNASLSSNAFKNLNLGLGIFASSAPPLTIRTGYDDNGDLIFNDRPIGVSRNSARASGQWNAQAYLSYMIPLGHKQVNSGGGVSISSSGGGYTVNMVGSQNVPRYRLVLSANIQNLTNHANYIGYSGVMTSPLFLQPTNVAGTRRINFNASLTF
jgi:hypothetical protein